MKLRLTVEHGGGTVDLETGNPFDLDGAAEAFRTFAFAVNATEVTFPSDNGPVVLKAGDIDRIDLTWEA